MSPSCTTSSGATRTSRTVPAHGALTGISIFIDSRIMSSSPSPTDAPTSVRTCHTLAVISARTSVDMGGQTSDVLFLLISIVLGGLIVGALGRLAIPGPNPMSIGQTILIGIGGSFIGGVVGYVLFRRGGGLILSVLGAALLVWLVERRRASA
jgi:uncharacterized membrane protein YeaQ/YmgE (transglycosylase-associated protein family)